jgi:hypothetical protein
MITPEEKAKELYNKFYEVHKTSNQPKFRAIDSCLISVDEIWNALESARVFEEYDYWQEVKQEIEKL